MYKYLHRYFFVASTDIYKFQVQDNYEYQFRTFMNAHFFFLSFLNLIS